MTPKVAAAVAIGASWPPVPASEIPLVERIARNLRALRESRGLTREQLAATTNVDAQMIKRIEVGRANPALVVLSRLAAALMLSVSGILGAEVDPEGLSFAAERETQAFESTEVGETLGALRRRKNVSQRELARLTELRTSTIHRYESGETDARVLEIEPIARALNLDTVELVRFIEQRQTRREQATTQWREPAAGVLCRVVSCGERSQVWEWRLEPCAEIEEEPRIDIVEDVVTMVRGRMTIAVEQQTHELQAGTTLTLPVDRARRFVNASRSPARLLRFQVRA